MGLSGSEKLRLNRAVLEHLRWRLLDKDGPVLPEDGRYYFETSPHDRAAIGAIAHLPDRQELESGRQPANSMGLVFLAAADEAERLIMEVEGRFDLEHAYIPDYADQDEKLVRDSGSIRAQQDLADAYKRYTVRFAPARFEIDTRLIPAAAVGPTGSDTLQEALQAHLAHVSRDPRVYRRLIVDARSQRPRWWMDWTPDITDQDTFNHAVAQRLFEPASTPLPYSLALQCRVRLAPGPLRTQYAGREFLVEVFLVNNTRRELAAAHRLYHHRVMDVNLRVRIVSGQHRKMRFRIGPAEYRYEPVQEIDGYGVTCAVRRKVDGSLVTETMPTYEQPLAETPSAEEAGMRIAPGFERLAREPMDVLDDFLFAMRRYLGEWEQRISAMAQIHSPAVAHARDDKQAFEEEVARVAAGIELLRNDAVLRRAFCLMNETMSQAVTIQRKPFHAWRLFQLGFILTQVGELANRAAPSATEPSPADVLWFPTGGGKTEAYLGLVAMAMLYQRLRGREYGVTAWMRFPLRMLSVQQFQRLAYVVGAANRIRQREQLPGFAFTIGYFTGTGTPNRISVREEYAAQYYLPNMIRRNDWKDTLRFIDACPHCNSRVEVQLEPRNFRIKHVCTNTDCWSNSATTAQGIAGELGIFVSDEECYRYLPTVMVGTLDKIVVLGHNKDFRNFFGAVTHFCPQHGFIVGGNCKHPVVAPRGNGEWDEPTVCPNNSRTSAARTVPIPPLPDPGFSFLINDELHLLREDLGNFDSHYESVLGCLQMSYRGGRAPKILAATATIRDFARHVHHLYAGPARRFPAGGMALDSSFYSRVNSDPHTRAPLVRRIYVGVQPASTSANMVAEWVCDANDRYHRLLNELIEGLSARPTETVARLGFSNDRAEVLRNHLSSMLRPTLIYVRRMIDADHVVRRFQADNEDLHQEGEVERVFTRLDAQTPLGDIQKVIARIEADSADDPIHEIVATSVVSHGVDIERINMEFFVGWPTSTAEYLQASSRSGRVHTGIVLVALDGRKLFEATAFASFCEYHRFIERLVEAVPINRFAPNVLPRTLPGIFNAVVLNWARRQRWGARIGAAAQSLSDALNQPGAGDAMTDMIVRSFGFERARLLGVFNTHQLAESERQASELAGRLVALFRGVQARYATELISAAIAGMYGFGPMQSLRDIERQVSVRPATLPDQQVLAALGQA